MTDFLKSTLLHPVLFAFFPIVFIFSINVDILEPNEIVVPFLIMGVSTVVLIYLIRFILKKEKTSIIISLGMILFFSYGYIFDLFDSMFSIKEIYLLGGFFLIFVVGILFLIKTKKKLDNFTTITNVVAISLISISAITIISYYMEPDINDKSNSEINDEFLYFSKVVENKPNVYFIILDAYSGSEVLEELFEFDNSDFLSFLNTSGFQVVKNSHSNYASTEESISSTFNMDYVHNRLPQLEGDYRLGVVGRTIDNNLVMNNFKSIGYQIINFNSGVGFTRDLQIADVTLCERFGGELMNLEMIRLLTKNSMIDPILSKIYQSDMRNQILCIYSKMNDFEKHTSEPFFAFVHIFIPHRPFIFDQYGNATIVENIEIASVNEDKEGYLNQLMFANMKTKEMITHILKTSKTQPIIIIQGDHGATVIKGLEEFNDAAIQERYSILNAFYFPKDVDVELYDGISSVNTFRIVFNEFFNSNYEILDDKSYLIDTNTSKSIDITEFLK